jgi:hypothetical protein
MPKVSSELADKPAVAVSSGIELLVDVAALGRDVNEVVA